VLIAVLVKQVPDSDEVKMDEEKGTMVRSGVGAIINPLDLHAIECAIDLREKFGGKVRVFSMGPPQAEEALREAVALGVDEVFLLTDPCFAAADTWATAKTLAAAIAKTGPYDLILAGEKATDGETGQVGPEVAVMLGLPFSTYVSQLDIEKDSAVVRRTVEDGVEIQRLPLPCLLTVLRDLNEPSMPTLAGKKKARRFDVVKWDHKKAGLSPEEVGLSGSPTRVVKIFYPKVAREGAFYKGKDLDKGIEHLLKELHSMGVLDGGKDNAEK
jgi:electron transfer flavoprotein beta subunit